MNLDYIKHHYRDKILSIASVYNAEKVRVFGSVARGEENENSDIDILVHFKEGASLLDEAGLERSLTEMLGIKVDLLADDSIKERLKPYILQEVVEL